MVESLFRPYTRQYRDRCLALFDANCPEFFAPGERDAYAAYLQDHPASYSLCEVDGEVAGAFGLSQPDADARRLNWIMLDPAQQGHGIGARILEHVLARCRESGTSRLLIAASHQSAAFFSRRGATVVKTTEHGWGPDMHRVDMQLTVRSER